MGKKFIRMMVVAGVIAMGIPAMCIPALAAMHSEYTVKNDKSGVNAYVYGKRTVLEFIDPPFNLEVKDKQGYSVSYERIGERFYRLARQLDKFSAVVNGNTVEFEVYKPEQIVILPPAPVAAAPAATSAAPVAAAPGAGPAATPAAPVAASASGAAPAPIVGKSVTPSLSAGNAGTVASAVVTTPADKAQVWTVEAADLSLVSTLKRWTRATQSMKEKWQLSWEIPVDYPVTITDSYTGTYEEAIEELLKGYSQADYRPKACSYKNRVIRVVRYLGTGTECD